MTSTGAGDGILMDAEALEEFMTAAFAQPLSWTIERVDLSGIRVRQPTSTANSRPGGTVSGPTLMSLADGVAYMVLLSRIGPAALAVTSNLHPAGFDTIMPKTLATAAVDRLLHHAHVIITEGTSLHLAEATAGRGVVPLN